MRILFLFILLLNYFTSVYGQSVPDQKYKLFKNVNYVSAKNYYLLTLFGQNKDAGSLIQSDTELKKIGAAKHQALRESLTNCKAEPGCYSRVLKFSDNEIKSVSDRLRILYKENNALGRLVKDHLYPSGTYILFNNLAPVDLLVKAWEQDAKGINFTIAVYAEGAKPNYPAIDSISFDVTHRFYGSFVHTASYVIADESKEFDLFFSIPLTAALQFLEINGRLQAADFEPMEETENKAAIEKMANINWSKYAYSVILIPGAGPNDASTALSAEAMLRLRLGAIQYRKGGSPYIVVSGGKVHPYKTQYCEAYEMKQFLITVLDVPDNAVIIEPHARHTTTNLRNCVRLIYRYGMPFNKPALSVTSRGQSYMISSSLSARCQKELGMVPFKVGNRLTETEVEFYPLIEALHIDPTEPMDP